MSLVALLGASWACFGVLAFRKAPHEIASTAPSSATAPTTSPDITEAKLGPWGELQLVPIVLELPDAFATVLEGMNARDRWNFAGIDREAALQMMASCGLTSQQLDVARNALWPTTTAPATFEPPDALLLELSPEVRGKLYSALALDPMNGDAFSPFWFRVGYVDSRLRGSNLSESSIALLKSLLYTGPDDLLLFNDFKPALRSITDPAERLRFVKATTRKRALIVRLTVNAETDTAALAQYWGTGGRSDNLLPLLDSIKFNAVSGIESPGRINISTLLPPFVQERLYRHAAGTRPVDETPDDCYWTAFNFFSEVPDDQIHDVNHLAEVLTRDYIRIDAPSQLGDVIMFTNEKGDAFHAANYIADDLVFTKNGVSGLSPWIISKMKDLVGTYKVKNPAMQLHYFRKRA